MPNARDKRVVALVDGLVTTALEPKGQTLYDRIKQYETENSRALKFDWDELRRRAWEGLS